MKEILKIFWIFLKIGSFTLGGGYAMIPLIEKEVVDNDYVTKEEFIDILAISQSLPGPISLNASCYIGYKIKGLLGGIIAMLGIVIPAYISILIIVIFFTNIKDNLLVKNAFIGINAAVPILIFSSIISLYKSIDKTVVNYIIFFITVVSISVFNVNPVIVIFLCGLFGVLYFRKKV
ncbi:MAG: chromate transporter [Clostridiaceae bacterium]